jgi:hypothetical protein
VEQEPIELGLGERIRPFLFERILRGQHDERFVQLMRPTRDRYGPLLHRFQQRGLSLGWRAVDFVGQQHLRENRTFDEHELPVPRFVFAQDYRPGQIGWHQVGRELSSLELQLHDPSQGADQQSLGQPRNAFDQAMPAR